MFKVIKNKSKIVKAYKLQKDSDTIQNLMKSGKITYRGDKKYEVHSLETLGGKGELAVEGDWIKIDDSGYPYPNSKEFLKHIIVWLKEIFMNRFHRHLMLGKRNVGYVRKLNICLEIKSF